MQLLIVLCFVLAGVSDAHGLFWSPTSRARLAKESGWTTDATSIISEPMPEVASGRPYPGGRPFAEPGKSMSNVGPCGMETYDSKKTNWNMPAHSWGSTQAQYTSGDTIDVSWCVSNLADHGMAALLLYLPLIAVCQGVSIRIGCALMTIWSPSLPTRLTHLTSKRWINWRRASRRAFSSAPTCLARIVQFIQTAKMDGAVSKPRTGNALMIQTDLFVGLSVLPGSRVAPRIQADARAKARAAARPIMEQVPCSKTESSCQLATAANTL